MAGEDYAGLNQSRKRARTRNNNIFNGVFREKLMDMYETTYNENQNKYTFDTYKFGLVDFWPKSNKLYVRRWNKYFENGRGFMYKHMINGS